MSDLLAALQSSAGAMQAFQTALETIGNNVSNSSTPGYANQTVALEALPFQPNQGLPGGVEVGTIQSARDEFSEQNVRQNVSTLGTFEATSQSLSALQVNFTVNSDQSIAGALNSLFQDFSSWSVTPTSGASQQTVLNGAQQLAQAFQQLRQPDPEFQRHGSADPAGSHPDQRFCQSTGRCQPTDTKRAITMTQGSTQRYTPRWKI